MWRIYSKDGYGITVQSTFSRLRQILETDVNNDFMLGLVQYIHYNSEPMIEMSRAAPFIYQRKSFEHEKELRAVVDLFPSGVDRSTLENGSENAGVKVPVNLGVLLEKVYIAPLAPTWFAELVGAKMKKHGLNVVPIHSNLDDDPVY